MKITKISVYQIDVPIEPFAISHNRVMSVFDETIVQIETDEGITGWGDSVPWGANFVPAWAKGVRAGIDELAPHLIGQDPTMLGAINDLMDFEMTGQPSVKSAIDVACWDILGQKLGVPLYMLFGGMVTPKPNTYPSVPPYIGEEAKMAVEEIRKLGSRRFSSKSSGDVAQDIDYLRWIGELLKPGEFLKYDGNGGWRVDEAIRVVRGMGKIDVYFEQPCATYEECKEVRRTTGVPLILDESVTGIDAVARAREDGILDGLNLKLGKVGGLSKMRQIRDFCVSFNVPMEIQDSSWSELACAVITHIAHSTPLRVIMSTMAPMGMKLETIDGGPTYENGTAIAPNTAGVGANPKLSIIGEPIRIYE